VNAKSARKPSPIHAIQSLRIFVSLALFISIFSAASISPVAAASNGLVFNVRQNATGAITANLAKDQISSGTLGYCGSATLSTINFTSWASPITCSFPYSQSFASGFIKAPFSGMVTLTTSSDDGVQVQVNDWIGINNWDDHAAESDSMAIPMVAGNYYPIKIWYASGGGGGVLSLSWSWPGQSSVIVPTGSLYQSENDFDSCVARSGTGPNCPGSSALQIKQLTGTNSDGLYWIDLNDGSGAKATYSIMNSVHGGGGWMLAMKGKDSASTFGYDSAYWKDANLLNSERPSRNNQEDVDAKYLPFTKSRATDVMVIFPDYAASTYKGAYPSSGDGFAWSENLANNRTWTATDGTSWNFNQGGDPSGTSACATYPSTMQTIFSNSSRCLIRKVNTTYSASSSPYDPIGNDLFYSQSQIRFFGFNYASTSTGSQMYKARFGFGWNENDGTNEASNDGTAGIGLLSSGMAITSGTRNGCCATQNGVSGGSSTETNFSFELFVKNTTTIMISGASTLRTQNGLNATTTYSADQGNTPTYALSPVIPGISINASTGVLTAANSLGIGTYRETVTVSNALGASAVRAVTIEVIAASGETDTALTLSAGKYAWAPDSSELDVTSAITLEAWVYQTSTNSGVWNMVMNKENSYELGTIGTTWYFGLQGSGGWAGVNTGISTKLNEWQHIALTRAAGSSTANLYQNGQLVWTGTADGASTGNLTNSSQPFTIGGRSSDGVNFSSPFVGNIDEVRVFRSARTQAEVISDMHTYGPINASNLILYYDFNEGTGNKLINRASGTTSASDLTIVGSPLVAQIAETSTSGPYTVVKFPRSYLVDGGGWKAPLDTITATVLTVGGGGGGAGSYSPQSSSAAGGGGGGGVFQIPKYTISRAIPLTVRVGVGGLGGPNGNSRSAHQGFPGTTTTFGLVSAGGGGGGGHKSSGTDFNGRSGTAGGGGGGASNYWIANNSGTGGTGSNVTIDGTVYAGRTGGNGAIYVPGGNEAGSGGGAGGAAGNGFVGPGIASDISVPGTFVTYGQGGTASGVAGWTFRSVTSTPGWGGDGRDDSDGYGASGANGIIIVRWITASAPIFTGPVAVDTTTALSRYTFRTSGAATSPLTRNFQWQFSTDTGTSWSTVQASTSDSYTTGFLDLGTSGPRYIYRVIVTDSDTAGLSISDSSTSYLVLNRYPTISPPVSNDTGLLVHLDASQSASYPGSGTSWNDISGNTKHASLGISSGGPVIAGHASGLTCSVPTFSSANGGAFAFAGDTVSTPRNCAWIPNSRYTDVGETFTVEVWANPATATQTTWTALITTPWYNGNDKVNFAIGFNGTTTTAGVPDIWGGIYDGSNWYQTPITGLPINSWSHVSLRSSNRVLTLYVNGEAKQSVSLAGANSISGTNKGVLIGRRWDGNQTYNGSIGTVRISNTALSAEQIRQNYYLSSNRFSNSASGVKSSSTTYAINLTETFTATNGTGTKRFTFTPNNRVGITWDTSTANSAVLRVSSTLNAGTYNETITATDSVTASTSLGLTITVDKANQARISIGQYEAYPNISTYPLNVYGGSGTGAVTRSIVETGTAGCVLSSNLFLTASQVGTCTVRAVKSGDINYLAETTTASILWITWSANNALQSLGGNHSIPLSGGNQFATRTETVTASAFSNTSGGAISSATAGTTIRINSTGFAGLTPAQITATFRPYEDGVVTAVTSTYVELVVPAGAVTGVIALDSPRGVAYTPSFTISP